MVIWKEQDVKFGGGHSCFGPDFAKGEPNIAKQLCDAAGQFVDRRAVTVNGYSYKVKIVPKKDGTGNWTFIERKQTYVGLGDEKPEETAHKQTLKEYPNAESPKGDWSAKTANGFDQRQKDIALAHQDNMRIHAEVMEASKAHTAAIMTLANELQGIKHLLEIMIGNGDAIKNSFKPASELNKKLPPEEARQ